MIYIPKMPELPPEKKSFSIVLQLYVKVWEKLLLNRPVFHSFVPKLYL